MSKGLWILHFCWYSNPIWLLNEFSTFVYKFFSSQSAFSIFVSNNDILAKRISCPTNVWHNIAIINKLKMWFSHLQTNISACCITFSRFYCNINNITSAHQLILIFSSKNSWNCCLLSFTRYNDIIFIDIYWTFIYFIINSLTYIIIKNKKYWEQ